MYIVFKNGRVTINLYKAIFIKGWGGPKQPQGQGDGVSRPNSHQDSAAVERLLKMEPKVECTGDSMKLQVQGAHSTPGSLLFVDRGKFIVCCGSYIYIYNT